MRSVNDALNLVRVFAPSPQEEKSRELILALLGQTESPFSRHQFLPGHITCTALVFHPDRARVLLVHHHRHRRWLLPGGHVEDSDESLGDSARREATEETAVRMAPGSVGRLAGLDVHGIPAHKGEPFHLHHDLVFALDAESSGICRTDEAPEVVWSGIDELERYGLPASILCAIRRAAVR